MDMKFGSSAGCANRRVDFEMYRRSEHFWIWEYLGTYLLKEPRVAKCRRGFEGCIVCRSKSKKT
jgi:hypothetical protein